MTRHSWVRAVRSSTLPPITKHVLLDLFFTMDYDGRCSPDPAVLARTTGRAEDTALKHITRAVNEGFLRAVTHRSKTRIRTLLHAAIPPKEAP